MSVTTTLTQCTSGGDDDDKEGSRKDRYCVGKSFEYPCICQLRTDPNCYCYGNQDVHPDAYHRAVNCRNDFNKAAKSDLNIDTTKSKVKSIRKRSTPKHHRSLSGNSSRKSEMTTSDNVTTIDMNSRLQNLEDLLTKFDNDKINVKSINEGKLLEKPTIETTRKPLRIPTELHDDSTAMELHKSKSYIVDLIDRALSKELGTIPDKQLTNTFYMTPKTAIDTVNRHVTADKVDNFVSRDFLKHLHQARRNHLKRIRKETKKLDELEELLGIVEGFNTFK